MQRPMFCKFVFFVSLLCCMLAIISENWGILYLLVPIIAFASFFSPWLALGILSLPLAFEIKLDSVSQQYSSTLYFCMALYAGLFFHAINNRKFRFVFYPSFLWLLFSFFVGVSSFLSHFGNGPGSGAANWGLVVMLSGLSGLAFSIYYASQSLDSVWVLHGLNWAGICGVLSAVLHPATEDILRFYVGGGAVRAVANPASLFLLCMITLLMFGKEARTKVFTSIWGWQLKFGFFFHFIVIAAYSSRGAMVAVVGSVCLFIAYSSVKMISFGKLNKAFCFLLIFFFGGIVSAFSIDSLVFEGAFEDRIAYALQRPEKQERFLIWQKGFENTPEHRFLSGLGMGGFKFLSDGNYPHSFFVSVFFETGLFSFVILLLSLFSLSAWGFGKLGFPIVAFVFGFCINFSTTGSITLSWFYFSIIAIFAVSTIISESSFTKSSSLLTRKTRFKDAVCGFSRNG